MRKANFFNETLSNGTDGGAGDLIELSMRFPLYYDIPDGGGLAIVFPNWLEHVLEEDPSRVKMLAMTVFGIPDKGESDVEIAKEGAKALRAFWNSLGAPNGLSDYAIELVINKTFIKPGVGLYKELDRESVKDILTRSM